MTAAAREAGVVVPLGAAVAQLMASARPNGDGGRDHFASLRGPPRLSGKNPDESDQAVETKWARSSERPTGLDGG